MPKQIKGYTLIEILIVVVIASITTAFAVIAFGDFGSERKILLSSEQFVSYVKLVQQQAILETKPFGILISNQGYQAFKFTPPDNWESLHPDGIFRKQYFPKDATLVFKSVSKDKTGPQIIIQSSGDISPFSLAIKSKEKNTIVIVDGNFDGTIDFKRAKSE